MSSTVAFAATLPRPRRVSVCGCTVLVCQPDAVTEPAADPELQPPLPFGSALEPRDGAPDLEPARQWVGTLGRVIIEVLVGRRPAAQLAGRLDDRSVAYLAAWANRGTLRPRSVGSPRLQVVSSSRVEGWMSFHTIDREFVAVLCLQHDGTRWSCRDLRVLAPAGGIAA